MIIKARLIDSMIDGIQVMHEQIGHEFLIELDSKTSVCWVNPITYKALVIEVVLDMTSEEAIPFELLELIP